MESCSSESQLVVLLDGRQFEGGNYLFLWFWFWFWSGILEFFLVVIGWSIWIVFAFGILNFSCLLKSYGHTFFYFQQISIFLVKQYNFHFGVFSLSCKLGFFWIGSIHLVEVGRICGIPHPSFNYTVSPPFVYTVVTLLCHHLYSVCRMIGSVRGLLLSCMEVSHSVLVLLRGHFSSPHFLTNHISGL